MKRIRVIWERAYVGAFVRGMASGAFLGALGAVICQMWLERAEKGEIEAEEGSESSREAYKHPEVLVIEQKEISSGERDKPGLAELTREEDSGEGIGHVNYAGVVNYKGDRTDLLSEEEMDAISGDGDDVVDFDGDEAVVVEEESDILDSRIRLSPQDTAPKIDKALKDAMNRRFEVISEGSYKGDNPYNDKYEATYFMADNVLAGFDGDLLRCGDEVMVAMAYDMIKVKGVKNLYLRDKTTDSDFWIKAVEGDYETAYEEKYGEKENQ